MSLGFLPFANSSISLSRYVTCRVNGCSICSMRYPQLDEFICVQVRRITPHRARLLQFGFACQVIVVPPPPAMVRPPIEFVRDSSFYSGMIIGKNQI